MISLWLFIRIWLIKNIAKRQEALCLKCTLNHETNSRQQILKCVGKTDIGTLSVYNNTTYKIFIFIKIIV